MSVVLSHHLHLIISGGADRVSRRGGHSGVQVQENLAPVPPAQVIQYMKKHNSLSTVLSKHECVIFSGFLTARMTRQRRDSSALLPRRLRRKSTHASYLSVTNW